MIVTITNRVTGKVTRLDVPDEKCDALLDKFACEFSLPNPEADQRWERMMQARAARELVLQKPQKRAERRR